MTTTVPHPRICVSANSRQPDDRRLPMYATAERYVRSLLKRVDFIPVLMPPMGAGAGGTTRRASVNRMTHYNTSPRVLQERAVS